MAKLNIAIIGGSGGIGSALTELLSKRPTNTVFSFSRSEVISNSANLITARIDYEYEESIAAAAAVASQQDSLDLVLVATGILHHNSINPEKSLRDLCTTNFEHNFLVNTIGPALVAKHFLPKLRRDRRAVFAALSARVGSISDNRLGGWYAYRASKASLNMVIKTASIEVARSRKRAIVVGLHPGTVATDLSKPFQRGVPKQKLFSPSYSANKLISVLEGLSTDDSGKVFAWDGCEIPS